MSSIRPGDVAFIRSGIPATVKERNETTGQLKLESDLKVVQHDMRHGYLNGLNPETRKQLYDILDEVKAANDDPAKRVEAMAKKLSELLEDPHNLTLARYLKAEMTHLMNTFGIKPREYSINESKAR